MAEPSGAEISVYGTELEEFSVETPGGRLHIRWYLEASATPNAQLAFFAEFLAAAGVYESWVNNSHCFTAAVAPPTSGMFSAPFLSILARHHRYAHITGLRDGGVSPQILGMSKIVSEDALRQAAKSALYVDTAQAVAAPGMFAPALRPTSCHTPYPPAPSAKRCLINRWAICSGVA